MEDFDPKLKAATLEIRHILKSYDIVGVFVLASRTHAEHRIELESSWSITHFDDSGYMRVKALEKDYASKEEHKAALRSTVNVLTGFEKAFTILADQMRKVLLQLGKSIMISTHIKTTVHKPTDN